MYAVNVAGWNRCLVVHAEPEKLIPAEILASSTLSMSEFGDYSPENLMDNNLSAAWVENAEGDGYGESVTFLFTENTVITGINIVTGYCKNEDIFYKNSAPSLLACYSTEGACYIDLSDPAEKYRYWYQYMRSDDSRLIFDNNVNRATISDMKDIIAEMFGSCEQEDIDVFLSKYILSQEGENLVMNASGDFGDAGEFVFGEPVLIAEGDQVRLEGLISVYDGQVNAYVPQKIYSAWFTLEPVGTEKIHTFIRMKTEDLN